MEWIIAVNVQKLVENAPKNAGKWQRNLERVVILMIATLFIYILTTKLKSTTLKPRHKTMIIPCFLWAIRPKEPVEENYWRVRKN